MTHRTIVFALSFLMIIHIEQNKTVFCTARMYTNSKTNSTVSLFGDIHCDIDAMGTITRLQQHTLLEAAQHKQAFVIAENVNFGGYNPYLWATVLAIDAIALGKLLKDKQYQYAALVVYLAAIHGTVWLQERKKTKKPDITIQSFINNLQQNYSKETPLQLFNYSPLFCLVQACTARGINTIDAEFRFHMLGAALEENRKTVPWFLQGAFMIEKMNQWIARKVTGNKVHYPITVGDYCDVNNAILQEINMYKDNNEALQNFYKICINSYESSYITQALRACNSDDSLAIKIPYLVATSGKDATTVWRDFSEHNKELLDARIVHKIFTNRETESIFVCTGADHTARIGEALEKIGYQEVCSYGKDNYTALCNAEVIGKTSIKVRHLEYLVVDLQKIYSDLSYSNPHPTVGS